jgi:NADPH-dependent 2,4-dienoyl-CoA reductase/sulfur reductase-like enzyme
MPTAKKTDVLIVGAGATGLILALSLKQIGIRTKGVSCFNKFGRHIFTEPAGEKAGYPWPQFSIHRTDMQKVFLEARLGRLGVGVVEAAHRCTGVE